MALEVNLEIEKDPEFELDMEILQFVGISDHSKLKNRDEENQHPVRAIEGLEFELQCVSERFQMIDETFEGHGEVIEQLVKFKENIATSNMIREVLNHE